jgi:hypothetical protein
MLTRRCGMRWRRRWKRTSGWREPAALPMQGAHHGDDAIVIPALAGTIGPAAALVTGVNAGSCAAASGPHVTRRGR